MVTLSVLTTARLRARYLTTAATNTTSMIAASTAA
jgi:hypothetical protein